jgi:transposase-like protein
MKHKDFHYRHFLPEVILQCLRWYLRYPISYRNLEEMMIERGIEVYHTTLYRWVQAYSVELAKRIRYYSKPYSTSWRVDETYIKVKGKWKYLYRAADKYGSTLDFMLYLLLHRQCKYLNNIIESDQRRIKRRINPMSGFKTFNTARRCIFGIEAMAMIIKKETHYLRLSILEQVQFVKRLFYIYD